MAEKQEPKYKNYRIDVSMAERIAKRTKRTNRSMTKEIRTLLEYALKAQQVIGGPPPGEPE